MTHLWRAYTNKTYYGSKSDLWLRLSSNLGTWCIQTTRDRSQSFYVRRTLRALLSHIFLSWRSWTWNKIETISQVNWEQLWNSHCSCEVLVKHRASWCSHFEQEWKERKKKFNLLLTWEIIPRQRSFLYGLWHGLTSAVCAFFPPTLHKNTHPRGFKDHRSTNEATCFSSCGVATSRGGARDSCMNSQWCCLDRRSRCPSDQTQRSNLQPTFHKERCLRSACSCCLPCQHVSRRGFYMWQLITAGFYQSKQLPGEDRDTDEETSVSKEMEIFSGVVLFSWRKRVIKLSNLKIDLKSIYACATNWSRV